VLVPSRTTLPRATPRERAIRYAQEHVTELHTKLGDLLRSFPALDAYRHLQVLVELEMSWRPPFAIPRPQLS
jgi:hypothetical protein